MRAVKRMRLSRGQQALFWRHFGAAWAAHARERGVDEGCGMERERYRRGLILQATGWRSLREVAPGEQFDRLLELVAAEAGDYEMAVHAATASARRIGKRVADVLRQVCEIAGMEFAGDVERWDYARGIMRQAYGRVEWEDIGEEQFRAVFMMLDTQRRRLLRREGWRGRMGYSYGMVWERGVNGMIEAKVKEVE